MKIVKLYNEYKTDYEEIRFVIEFAHACSEKQNEKLIIKKAKYN